MGPRLCIVDGVVHGQQLLLALAGAALEQLPEGCIYKLSQGQRTLQTGDMRAGTEWKVTKAHTVGMRARAKEW